MTLSLGILVLTYNEEINIAQLLDSLEDLSKHVFVVDSGSTDRTVEIAKSYGVVVAIHPWLGYAKQIDWGIDNFPFNTDWIMRVDADEYVSDALAEELKSVLPRAEQNITAYYVNRRFYFLNRWIRHGGYYPSWILRVFRRDMAHSDGAEMNERMVISCGDTAFLSCDLIHNDLKGLSEWTLKHEKYAELEIRLREAEKSGEQKRSQNNAKASSDWLRQNVYLRTPLFVRPFLYFIYRYFIRLGFLDGRAGFIYHFLHTLWYQFYIDSKIWEKRVVRYNMSSLSNASPAAIVELTKTRKKQISE